MIEITTSLYRSAKPQILVVEDNPDQWFIIRWALLQRFPEVEPVWAASTEQAMAYLQTTEHPPKLILLDLYLPSRQVGWTLLEIIKSHDLYRNTPVVMLSSSNIPGDITGSYHLRSNSFIVKPSRNDEWLSCFAQFRHYWWQAVMLPNAT